MSYFQRRYSYSKIEEEDPDERNHRRAQRLIARVLEKADSPTRRRRFRMSKLKIKIGRRLNRLRKSVQCAISMASVGMDQFKLWKFALRGRDVAAIGLPPLFG